MEQTGSSGMGQGESNASSPSSSVADVLALLHGEANAHPAAAYAVELAKMLGAHLTVTGVTRDPARQFYLAQAQAQVLAAAVDAARTSAHAFAGKVSADAAERGVAATALVREVLIGQGWGEVAQFARLFDIAVLAQPNGEEAARDEAMLEAVLLQAGRAVIVVPPSYARPVSFERPILAWDGSRGAVRALAEAMPILRQAGQVQIVSVARHGATPEIPDITPHLERHGVACTSYEDSLSYSVAQTLLDHAHKAASNLLVMGAFGHLRLREMMLGGTTRDILRLADLPVLLAN